MLAECDLSAELAQRRREAAADPAHRALMERPRKPPTLQAAVASILSPEAIAAADRRREAVEAHERDAEQARREAAWQSFVDRRGCRYADCTLDNFDVTTAEQSAVVTRLREYRGNLLGSIEAGVGILLYGPCGTGKDHLLIELVKLSIAAGKSVAWMNGGDMFGMFRDNMDEAEREELLINRLVRPDVLYLSDPLPPPDDKANAGSLPWFRRETLYRVIDKRYSRDKPLWITANVSGAVDLDARMGPECGTRLRDGAVCLFCNWPMNRKPLK